MSGFARRVIVREAYANALAHRALAGILVLIAAIAPLAAVTLDIVDVHGSVERERELAARGSTVFSVTAVDRQLLPATRCDALGTVTGVASAGGITAVERVHSALTDRRPLTFVSATPGLAAVLWPGTTAVDGVIVGASIGSQLGLVAGAVLPIAQAVAIRSLPVGAVAQPSTRSADYDLLVLQSVPPRGGTYECLVESEPGARARVEAVLLGWFSGTATAVTPYFVPPDTGRTPQQEASERTSAWFPLAAAGLVALGMLAWWVIRRSEFALYGVMGLSRDGLVLMLVTEWAMLCLLPGSIGLANALGSSAALLDDAPVAQVAALDVVRYLASISVIPLLGTALLTRVTAFEALKGK
ncbi:MAG: hypothetical protein JWP85_2311 [Rhodoglobus sp.]|nr:hypothetical protein [Rhodoglobus sp.]